MTSYYMPETKAGIIPNSVSEEQEAVLFIIPTLFFRVNCWRLEFSNINIDCNKRMNIRPEGEWLLCCSLRRAYMLQLSELISYMDRGGEGPKLRHDNPGVEYW